MNKSLKELFKNVETHPQEEFDWGEQEYIARLEKALDKACEWIVNYIGECPSAQFNEGLSDCEENCCDDYVGCWKKWVLKEVQENE